MVAGQLLDILHRSHPQGIRLIQRLDAALPQHFQKTHKNLCRAGRIVHCPVVVVQRDFERFRHRIQLKAVELGHQHPCQRHRIHHRVIAGIAQTFTILADKAHVKARIVRHHNRPPAELQKLWQRLCNLRRVQHHVVTDSGQFLNLKRNRHFGVYKRRKAFPDLPAGYLHSPNLNHLIVEGRKPCRLQVKYHIGILQALAFRIFNDILKVVHQVSLHPINHLKAVVWLQRMVGVRKCLYIPMVRYGNRLMPPFLGALDDGLDLRHAVHIAHFRMAMELHPFLGAAVHTGAGKIRDFLNPIDGTNRQLPIKAVNRCHALDFEERPLLDSCCKLFYMLIPGKHLHHNRIRKIRHREHKDGLLIADFPSLQA